MLFVRATSKESERRQLLFLLLLLTIIAGAFVVVIVVLLFCYCFCYRFFSFSSVIDSIFPDVAATMPTMPTAVTRSEAKSQGGVRGWASRHTIIDLTKI